MRALGKKHAAIMDTLTAGLDDDRRCRRKIDNRKGTYMPVVIEKVGPRRYSVAHYYEQNGDLVPDPDLEFVKNDGKWYPVAITQWCGYRSAAETDENGQIVAHSPQIYRDILEFARIMLVNIKEQQGDLTVTATKGGE